jgi:YHS domain-containing protein
MLQLIISLMILFPSLQASANSSGPSSGWKVVANKEVCMVTNVHFARPQIPVEAGGKTYYGCCENCKATIQNDAAARVATDPLTKKQVDKAKATIASDSSGAVLYFESKANFDRYVAQQPRLDRK